MTYHLGPLKFLLTVKVSFLTQLRYSTVSFVVKCRDYKLNKNAESVTKQNNDFQFFN